MLKKLIKHEFKFVWKFLTMAAAFMIILTVVGAIGIQFMIPEAVAYDYDYVSNYGDEYVSASESASAGVSTGFGFSGMLAALYVMVYIVAAFLLTAGTYIYLWMRFDKSMYGHQGYLTNTLPTTPAKLITAKLITAVTWVCVSIALLIGSIITLALATRNEVNNNIPELFADLKQAGIFVPGMITLYVVLIFAAIVMSVLMMYGSSALGQMAKKSRTIATLAFYFAMTMVINVVATFTIATTYRIYSQNEAANFIGVGTFIVTSDDYVEQIGHIYRSMNWTAFIFLILIIAGSAALYFVTHHITSKRLNLE